MSKPKLALLREVAAADRAEVFKQKLQICSERYAFQWDEEDEELKEEKRETLLELIDFINVKKSITDALYKDTIEMVKKNLFRPLPPCPRDFQPNYDPDEEEPFLEPAWPHLQLVYEFLLRFIVSSDVDPKVAKKHIDKSFIVKLLELFDSEDPRERDYLKTILHRVYGKFMSHRPFIRRSISNTFYRFVFEKPAHNGISELLEILGSIINGFALPLKAEHQNLLIKALLPLHKPSRIDGFQQQLAYCVTQFVEKDPTLAETVIRSLLSFWPVQASSKTVMLLGELEEILELTQPQEFVNVAQPLCHVISQCVISPHFQVAERALFLWNNEHIVQQITNFKDVVFPLIFPCLAENAGLVQNSEAHWNQTVHGLTSNVQKLLMEIDTELYDEEAAKYTEAKAAAAAKAATAASQWEAVHAMAEKK